MNQSLKKNEKKCIFRFAGIFFWAAAFFSYGVQSDEPLVEKVAKRVESYPEYKNWRATVLSTETKLDKNGEPEEVTVVTRKVMVIGKEREEEILKVIRTKKGITTDITEKYREESRERQERLRKKQREREKEKKEEKQGLELSLNALFPFGEKRRTKYEFVRLDDSRLDDKAVYVLEARLKDEFKKKDKEDVEQEVQGEPLSESESKEAFLWEGKYYIETKTLDVLKLEVRPARKQRFVKRFEIEMSFALLENGYFVVRRVKTLVNAGFLFKHIRLRVEEEYSDFEILD